jgi:anti-sigma-K factor RskA
MTNRDEPTGTDGVGDAPENFSGAYVLDALSDDERHTFEEFLEGSPDMQREVAELRETALLLAHAAPPVTPSAELRSSLLEKIARTAQLPPQQIIAPETAGGAGDDHERVAPQRRPVPEMEPSETEARVLRPTGAAERRWFTRPVAILGAAAAAAGLFFGGGAVISAVSGPGQSQEATASALDEIYAAPDFQRTVAEVSTGGTATLVWSNELQRSAIVADGLTSLPGDRTYELWYIGEDGAVPAGTFDTTTDSAVTQVLKGEMSPGDVVGITVEPTGGSDQPTTDPIVALPSA